MSQFPTRLRQVRVAPAFVAAALLALLLAACGSSSHKRSAASQKSSTASMSSTGASSSTSSSGAGSSAGLKKGLTVYVIPKNLGNPYFTVADSVQTHGALYALKQLGEHGIETSGSQASAASQLPAIQAAIAKSPAALIISATDPTALCPTLRRAMAQGIKVVTYDSDAPTCRNMFVNQASAQAIGDVEVQILAHEMHDQGDFAIVSAEASATNQNTWIAYMKQYLKNYPKMHLVSIVYGNDDPTTSTQVTEGLLEKYPNLKGIISPTTVGIAAAAAVLDTPRYRGKVQLTGLGTPNAMRKFVDDGTVGAFALWDPAKLGYLAAYTAVNLVSGKITGAQGQKFSAGDLGTYTIGADHTVLLGPPLVFDKANINNYHF
jgi:rhamnose transport system substrate-binding protein